MTWSPIPAQRDQAWCDWANGVGLPYVGADLDYPERPEWVYPCPDDRNVELALARSGDGTPGPIAFLHLGSDFAVCFSPAGGRGYPAGFGGRPRAILEKQVRERFAEIKQWLAEGREFRMRIRRPDDFDGRGNPLGWWITDALGRHLRTEYYAAEVVERKRAA